MIVFRRVYKNGTYTCEVRDGWYLFGIIPLYLRRYPFHDNAIACM